MVLLLYTCIVAEEENIYRQAELQAKNMPLSVVRLSFRAYLNDRVLPAVMSNPIYDSSMHIISIFCACSCTASVRLPNNVDFSCAVLVSMFAFTKRVEM